MKDNQCSDLLAHLFGKEQFAKMSKEENKEVNSEE